ncbi:Polynucleotide 5'-hydroxyl-kinase grc3 [Sphaceloma murrayae]|uniref:Polynucleotide 5'-hydroxyl-kinase GRC3 n=1 Tax=Sphaceloma murrayae TaxID=2082308 RepID=A0A2K1QQE1_9PEZI|nr:Polynucleotide 5'-hydroxyl-kinase grc3 [Sphaceloma murrayae]
MPKRKAAEALSSAPQSAFAAARAFKTTQDRTQDPLSTTTTVASSIDGTFDVVQSRPPQLERHEAFGYTPETPGRVESETVHDTTAQLPETVPLANYRRSALETHHDRAVLKLEAGEWLAATGIYDLLVREGAVSIYGAYLPASSERHRVFAPLSHALPVIKARRESVVEILSVECELSSLVRLSPLWNRIWKQWQGHSFALATPNAYDPLLAQAKPLEIDVSAQKILNRFAASDRSTPATVLVVGSKASGKSTFCRCLSNALVSNPQPDTKPSCFWLDIDPGQPEFGSAGCVSFAHLNKLLLGPGFTHIGLRSRADSKVIRSHTLAATSPKEDMDHYMTCVTELNARCRSFRKTNANGSIIINCPGWTTGSGAALLQKLAENLSVTDVIILESDALPMDPLSFPEGVRVRTLRSHSQASTSRPAAETRAMQTMSYFHSGNPGGNGTSWSSRPISSFTPLTMSYAGRGLSIDAILSYHQNVSAQDMMAVLDGALVAIVRVSTLATLRASRQPFIPVQTHKHPSPQDPSRDTALAEPHGIPIGPGRPLDPTSSQCLGQAIVKRIDPGKKQLHLITPVTEEQIRQSVSSKGGKDLLVLVYGKFDRPDWAHLEDVYHRDFVARGGQEDGADQQDAHDPGFDLSEEEEDVDVADEAMKDIGGKGEGTDVNAKDNGLGLGLGQTDADADAEASASSLPPYVAMRFARTTNSDKADGEARTGEILSERVWRPRHLPRNTR